MAFEIREMSIDDYAGVFTLWEMVEGVGLSESDSKSRINTFLDRNPGFSFVACDGDQVIGAILCGHDGRRGYLHHLAVHPSYRKLGLGKSLVERCFTALDRSRIQKCHLFVFKENKEAIAFWKSTGWTVRDELEIMSRFVGGDG